MKKGLPLFLGMLVGFYAVLEFYIPADSVHSLQKTLLEYGLILAAAAYVLGGVNVIQVNWPKIRRREADWQFKVLLLAAAVFMGAVGVAWHTFGGERQNGYVSLSPAGAASDGKAYLRVHSTRERALVDVTVEGATPQEFEPFKGRSAWEMKGYKPLQVAVPAGKPVSVRVFMERIGYGEYKQTMTLQPGQVAQVNTDLVMNWGKQGRVYMWMYNHVFDPCNSTMFALLAFFIASAAFRAFRARNTEAALLLGAAILIMLGRAPVGGYVSSFFPNLADWIVDIPNNAGRRAIMMGAALGAIVTGLRVILGLERSHLGSD